ncbi:hypothetical protein P775_01890 [Puniceibacterium antarcticum]|uniref:Uncharacterized protein n=1 Tax=Puniceibacterium antarcticum TaxID=1206336 RepID=A0A2G8RK93_9RHOB|nr:hypothetical protein [Puniceibacterium antarcticum]PIL21967.1 hypothetical protein P775_01890 [Puniceibacterium antarcticum]
MKSLATLILAIPLSLVVAVWVLVICNLSLIWILPIYAVLGAVMIIVAALFLSNGKDE